MIEDKNLKYLTTVDSVEFYEYKAKLFRYFHTPMAYYEKLFSRMIRETLDYIRGGYHVIYMAADEKLVGYGVVTKGGGRNKFCTRKDIVFGSLWVQPEERGKGLSNILVHALSECLDFEYEKAYEYIRHDNYPSIKAAVNNGFIKIANAKHVGKLRSIVIDKNGGLGIYEKKHLKGI